MRSGNASVNTARRQAITCISTEISIQLEPPAKCQPFCISPVRQGLLNWTSFGPQFLFLYSFTRYLRLIQIYPKGSNWQQIAVLYEMAWGKAGENHIEVDMIDENVWLYIDGLIQERRNSIANTLELHLSCTNPSTYFTRHMHKCIAGIHNRAQ